ncbi:MAG TPA: nucleotidyltransferase family protein [Anaerolineae bacterium]|nr:nucleotidyltransferase family protein [Anaerolineae bacterium]
MRITAIVLAAGQSQRMGKAKLLLPWRDQTVLGQTLTHVIAANTAQTLVVGGAYRPKIEKIATHFKIPYIHNPDYATGEMLSSLQIGIQALPEETDAVLVMLGDMPMLEPATITHLINTFQHSDKTVVVPTFEGRRGHPVIFGRTHFPALLALDGHKGHAPRHLLREIPDEIQVVPVETQSILIDLDTKEMYDHWVQKKTNHR